MKQFLSVMEVKQQLGIGQTAVYQLVNRADFPKLRIGRKLLIPADSFRAWLAQNIEGDTLDHRV